MWVTFQSDSEVLLWHQQLYHTLGRAAKRGRVHSIFGASLPPWA